MAPATQSREDTVKEIIVAIFMFCTAPSLAFGQVQGQVSCDKGVDMTKVQELVKKTVEALKKDQAGVIKEVNSRDKKWKDGDL